MALQPLLATLVIATLGLTAYVSSVTREVRQIVSGARSYAQGTTTAPTTTTTTAPATTTTTQPSATTTTPPASTPPPTGDQGQPSGQYPGQPGQQRCGPDGCAGIPGNMMGPGGPGGQYGPGPGGYPGGGQMGPGGYGGQGGQMMGPGGPGGPGGYGGPSEEDMKRMEEMQKKQEEQGLKQMQRGIKQMMQPIRMLLRKIDTLKQKGLAGLDQMETEVNELKTGVEAVMAAQTMEEAQTAMEGVMTKFGAGGDPFQEFFTKLQMLEQVPRMLKELNAQIKRLTRETDQLARRATRTKFDLGSAVEEVRGEIAKLETARDAAKVALETGDFENPGEIMQGFFDQMDEVQQKLNGLRAVIDLTATLRGAEQQIRQDEAIIKQLKRQKKDTAELETLVASGKEILSQVKKLAAARPLNIDALMEAAESGAETQQQFEETVMALRGEREVDEFFDFKEAPKTNFDFSQFRRGGTEEGGGGPGGMMGPGGPGGGGGGGFGGF